MIPSAATQLLLRTTVYQRGWMIDSQLGFVVVVPIDSISKGMDD